MRVRVRPPPGGFDDGGAIRDHLGGDIVGVQDSCGSQCANFFARLGAGLDHGDAVPPGREKTGSHQSHEPGADEDDLVFVAEREDLEAADDARERFAERCVKKAAPRVKRDC